MDSEISFSNDAESVTCRMTPNASTNDAKVVKIRLEMFSKESYLYAEHKASLAPRKRAWDGSMANFRSGPCESSVYTITFLLAEVSATICCCFANSVSKE